jgi:lipid A 3-O-deacylase
MSLTRIQFRVQPRILSRFQIFLLAVLLIASALPLTAQSPELRDKQPWAMGPFLNYGNGVGVRSDFHFLMGGFEAGKVLTPVVHAGLLSGQFEFGSNIMPLWQAWSPAPHLQYSSQTSSACLPLPTNPQQTGCYEEVGGGHYSGVSVTPVIFRWNFATHSRRIQPWFQAAAGLIYTTHKFPPDVLVPHGTPGGTSVWNFSPQGGGGVHIFTRSHRSIDIGVNGVHISSASLGDRNPGVNASVQVQVGYTFWR